MAAMIAEANPETATTIWLKWPILQWLLTRWPSMPVLQNPKHEIFAQELAKGKSASEAHTVAGYSPNRWNAATLSREEHIQSRVSELLTERKEIHRQGVERAVERVSLTKEWVIEGLMENAQRALQREAVLDDDGKPIGEYHYQGNVANRAFELLGKELGMFIDRKETGAPGEFAAIDNMNGPELLAFLAQKVAASPSPDDQDETRH